MDIYDKNKLIGKVQIYGCEVVTYCKDCSCFEENNFYDGYCFHHNINVQNYDYCSNAKRKEYKKMRLPTYYCPHCKRFKRDKWYDRDDRLYTVLCRCCGTDLILTENILLEIVEERIVYKNEHNTSL